MAIGNALFIGWNRAITGREPNAVELFAEVNNQYEAWKKAGHIASYEHFFLYPHGGDLNGFTMIKGDPAKLDEVVRSDEWVAIQTKAIVVLDGFGVTKATHGEAVGHLVQLYLASVPRK
jgi:hypothetical protein